MAYVVRAGIFPTRPKKSYKKSKSYVPGAFAREISKKKVECEKNK